MNNKLTLPDIVALVSNASGRTKKQTEEFLKELFALVSASLADGEQVKIKGIGTFKVTNVEARKSVDVTTGAEIEIPGHKKISFSASRELAEAVNAPFQAFEPVELSDSVTDDMLNSAGDPQTIAETAESEKEVTQAIQTPEPEIVSEDTDRPEDSFDFVSESQADQIQTVEDEEFEPSDAPRDETVSPTPEPRPSKRRFGYGFAVGFASAACLAVLGIALWRNIDPQGYSSAIGAQPFNAVATDTLHAPVSTVMVDEPQTEVNGTDNVIEVVQETEITTTTAEPATRPSDEPVYDTITKTRYLTTMAKEHYGNYHLWPYIYEENKARLGHPDRIRPGTKVVIPPLSKYGVNPASKADIAAAKKKGVEIYNRYK